MAEDVLEIPRSEEEKALAAWAEDAAKAVARYEQVKDLGLTSGFVAFADELRHRAEEQRQITEDLLDGILLRGRDEDKHAYTIAKIQLLALETAFWLYKYMRDEQVKAKQILDARRPKVLDSTQNGPGTA